MNNIFKRLTSTTLFVVITLMTMAQIVEQKPYIEITGTSEIKIVPNQIYMSITLQEHTDKSKKSIVELEKELVKALKSLGISPSKLVVADANSYYGKTGMIGKDVVNSKKFELELATATDAKKVFEQLDDLNIKNAFISRVDHSEMEEYKKQAKIKAIKAAKAKANYLLDAVGEELGPALIVRENTFNISGNHYRSNANSRMFNGFISESRVDKSETKLDFKKITISASIYTKWRIGS
ncbi:MAG: SIMPL domain-containing protein [Bacteroidia bacterium]